jgi:polynucleotide 5'-kinase involved in rRNA processing
MEEDQGNGDLTLGASWPLLMLPQAALQRWLSSLSWVHAALSETSRSTSKIAVIAVVGPTGSGKSSFIKPHAE